MNQVQTKAKEMGIKISKRKKADLIRTIQEKEGNFPCFQTASGFCDQSDCSWKQDCISV